MCGGGFGYTVNKSIGYGYVRSDEVINADFVRAGTYELEVATKRVPCTVQLGPLYDPKMDRVKC